MDDNVDAAETTALLLGFDGHEVKVAHDGPSALLLASGFHPDAIVLDIGLPDMDGYEVARRFREMPEFAKTMLIALSGYAGDDHLQRSEHAGFDHRLVKPVVIAELNAFIAAARRK